MTAVHAMFMQFPVVVVLSPLVWEQVPAPGRVFGFVSCGSLGRERGISMISEPPVLLTEDGLLQLQGELDQFRERYADLARVKAESPDDADDGMLTDMTLLQRRMAEIEDVLSRASLLDGAGREPGVVGIGSRVTVHWEEDGEETYTIVDPAEVDVNTGRISHESPVGEALIGRRAGDRVAVNTFSGSMWLSIVSVHS